MQQFPLISIIVAVYKAEGYLEKCINSLLKQTFKDFEILLIDDGSPDNSGIICDEYAKKDNRIQVYHKENGGVSSARQLGLNKAKGKYIIHADPDDWIEDDMLEELYSKAENENADMTICDYYVDFKNSNKTTYVNQKPNSLEHIQVLEDLFNNLHGSGCNKLIKKDCFDKFIISYPQEIKFCEDLYVNAALLKNNIKVAYLPKAFYHYVQYINTNSLTSSYSINTLLHDKALVNTFDNLMQDHSVFISCHNKIVNIILKRAFNSRMFTSKEFKANFSEYAKEILNNKSNSFIERYILYYSCCGYYNILSTFVFLIRKIIKRNN